MPQVTYPIIPETITVHLGTPDSKAENVTVPFIDYIKKPLAKPRGKSRKIEKALVKD